MKTIEIPKEPFELNKLLKFANLVSSGGEAKFVINEELVSVNGTVETRKRRKIVSGDIISFQNEQYHISVIAADTEQENQ